MEFNLEPNKETVLLRVSEKKVLSAGGCGEVLPGPTAVADCELELVLARGTTGDRPIPSQFPKEKAGSDPSVRQARVLDVVVEVLDLLGGRPIDDLGARPGKRVGDKPIELDLPHKVCSP